MKIMGTHGKIFAKFQRGLALHRSTVQFALLDVISVPLDEYQLIDIDEDARLHFASASSAVSYDKHRDSYARLNKLHNTSTLPYSVQ